MSDPTIGRIVHYVSYGTPGGEYPSVCRAAIVTAVDPATDELGPTLVSLAVFNPTGMFFNDSINESETHLGGTWHWPCVRTEETR
jgi:hypothetical protein